ncbi:neuropeptide Y receptor type 2 [Nomia melanderi]|uniref:neuropeptide Y receptor type 2 n=1 Tax=Nomia melanderi TaxID=2448451 RepID=UPI00130429D4|nr:galanin receptor type 1 [Nomia melanderi]
METLILQNRSIILNVQWNCHVENKYEISTTSSKWEDIDTSKYLFPSEIWGIRPTWEVIVKILSVLPIVVIGSLANSGLIYVVVKEKSLQTTTNLLIVNMCIADLGTCLICPWMFLCTDLFENYILGDIGCRLDGSLLHALTLVAVFNLSAISYDRVSAIVFNCAGKLTRRMTYILLFTTWISAIAVAAPLSYFRHYYERQWKNYLETFCTEDAALVYPYWHIFAGLSVWAPLAIMAICYSAILIKLDRYESQALRSKYPIVVKYKGRVAQVLALIVLVFIIGRVPFTALIITRSQLLQGIPKLGQARIMYPLWYMSKYLVLVNAAVNPLLYGWSSSSLRKELSLCSVTSWLIHKKKEQESKPCSISQLKSDHCLRPRSPCIRMNYNERYTIPNILSSANKAHLNTNPI